MGESQPRAICSGDFLNIYGGHFWGCAHREKPVLFELGWKPVHRQ